jgi:hypothetical protein
MDPCLEWWCYMGYLGCFAWRGRIRGRILFKGVECNIPKKCWPKVDFRCVDEGKGCGSLDAKSEVIWGVVSFPFSLSWPPPPFFPWLAAPLLPLQPPSIASSSLDLPLCSKDWEEEEHVELKRKRGSRRCSTPSLLADFIGETLGKVGILVPPCNYVLLEVVDHED